MREDVIPPSQHPPVYHPDVSHCFSLCSSLSFPAPASPEPTRPSASLRADVPSHRVQSQGLRFPRYCVWSRAGDASNELQDMEEMQGRREPPRREHSERVSWETRSRHPRSGPAIGCPISRRGQHQRARCSHSSSPASATLKHPRPLHAPNPSVTPLFAAASFASDVQWTSCPR